MQLTKRVTENRISETDYRALKDRLNYSGIRKYLQNRVSFMNEYILGQKKEEADSASSLVGKIVHCLLLEPEKFDSQYVISSAVEPTGQTLELCQNLYKISMQSVNSDGVQTRQFEELFLDAVNKTKYDWDMKEIAFKGKSVDKILEIFTTPDKKTGASGELFYKELMANSGKVTVTITMIQNAEKVVNTLKSHPFTRDIINKVSTEECEIFNELPILFTAMDIEWKALIDKLEVNHAEKYIQPWDLKISYDNEVWEYNVLKGRYDLQGCIYETAVIAWSIEHGLEGYEIRPLKFITADSIDQICPLIYPLTIQHISMAMGGYWVRGRYYEGLANAVSDIRWHLETGDWKNTRSAIQTNGVMELNIPYGS